MTNETREKITDTAIDVMREMRYNNAGTVELLFKKGNFYFMEVNSRIQVEHAITEEVTRVDIVAEQLRIASGDGLSIKQADIRSRGHAIECRRNAEHPISFVPFYEDGEPSLMIINGMTYVVSRIFARNSIFKEVEFDDR